MIYTSYFAKIRKLPENIVPISISAKPPQGYTGLQCKKLAPTYNILMDWKQNHDNEAYIEAYHLKILSRMNPEDLVKELYAMVPDGKDIALVCFEKSTDFCHRHLIAKWLNEAGFECAEWSN